MTRHHRLAAITCALSAVATAAPAQTMSADDIRRHCEAAAAHRVRTETDRCRQNSPRANCDGYRGREAQFLAACRRDLTRSAAAISNWPRS